MGTLTVMDNGKKDKWLKIRVTETDLEMLRRLSDGDGRTMSGYIRRLISLEVDKKQLLKDASYGN